MDEFSITRGPSDRRYKFITRPITKLLGLSAPSAPQASIPPLPPAPSPIQPPTIENEEGQAQQIQKREDLVRQEEEDRRRRRKGRGATLFAGRGLGTAAITTAQKTLLGE